MSDTTTKKIVAFRVSWTADHAQYYQGHSIMFSDYTHSGNGCGETIREAFEDALDDLAQQLPDETLTGVLDEPKDPHDAGASIYPEMLAELTGQVKEPGMLDWDIVRAQCPEHGEHMETVPCLPCNGTGERWSGMVLVGDCGECNGNGTIEESAQEPDCAMCAGERHFYVNVDVQVENC